MNVQILFPENLVNIRAGTTQLIREPSNGFTLFVKCTFYQTPGVYHFIYRPCPNGFLLVCTKKRRGAVLAYPTIRLSHCLRQG